MYSGTGTKPSVLFIYMGLNRRELLSKVEAGHAPSTAFRGFTLLRTMPDIDASFLDLGNLPSWALPLKRFVPRSLLHLLHLWYVRKYDFVITSDTLLLAWIASYMGRTRWIFIPMNSSVLMRRHAKHPFRLLGLKLIWARYARIAYITEGQRKDFLRFGIKDSKLVSLPFGVDAHFFAEPTEATESGFILSVGRDLGRDYLTLFATARKLPYRFIIATAPKNIPEGIEIPSNVEIRYNVDAEGIRILYRGATCVAIFLKGEETTEGSDCTGQTVMLEALSAGQCIVVTDRTWIREYFPEREEYLSIPSEDVEAAAQALTRLWENTSLRQKLASAGAKKVQEVYNMESYAEGLARIIRECDVG